MHANFAAVHVAPRHRRHVGGSHRGVEERQVAGEHPQPLLRAAAGRLLRLHPGLLLHGGTSGPRLAAREDDRRRAGRARDRGGLRARAAPRRGRPGRIQVFVLNF